MTVLLTTHYLDEADAVAERILIVDHGRILADGSADELKRVHVASHGTTVARANAHGPTLDDVFLTLTGRSLRDAAHTSQEPS